MAQATAVQASGPAADYAARLERPRGDEPAWLADLREAARLRFAATGFPDPRSDKWKTIDLSPVTKTVFEDAPDGASTPVTTDVLAHLRFGDLPRVVLVDGVLRSDLSELDRLPDGLGVCPLPDAAARETLGTVATDDHNPFLDLNTAAHQGGVFVRVAPGAAVEVPLHVLVLSTGTAGTVRHPRVLVAAGKGSEAKVVEQHAALANGAAWSNAVTELDADAAAHLDHILVQQLPPAALHTGTVQARAAADATVRQASLALGGGTVRTTLTAELAGEGSTVLLHGLYVTAHRQRVDHWTRVDHAVPHGTSVEVYKGILDDESRGAFTGNVLVRPGAQKTDSTQENRNILLSPKALVETTPQLEIHADDVTCSHGSTVGQLDDEALFFLRSRGIGAHEAKIMLTKAFAGEVTGALRVAAVREAVDTWMEAWFDRRGASA